MREDFLVFPGEAELGPVLQAYVDNEAHYWWLLLVEQDGVYGVCSFGSLLPYLLGRTDHIVHPIGECVVCSGMDPLLWQATDALVREALADEAVCRRQVRDLPLGNLRETAVTLTKKDGKVVGVTYPQVKGGLESGMPDF